MIYTGKMAKLWSYQRSRHFRNYHRTFASKASANLKEMEVPKNNRIDTIGPPDSVSNLRPIIFAKNEGESATEKKYREARETTQIWNQHFWTKHNNNFAAERKEFQEALKEKTGKDSVTADEMSVFYKRFLDKNWRTHLEYNVSWYKQNVKILLLEIRVRLSKMKFR